MTEIPKRDIALVARILRANEVTVYEAGNKWKPSWRGSDVRSSFRNGRRSGTRSAWAFFSTRGPGWVVLAGVLACGSVTEGQESAGKQGAGASTSRPDSDSLRFASGLLRQKKFDLAAQEYERILKAGAVGAERDDARFGLGSAWLSVGRYREARGAFDDFLRGAPDDSRALSARFRLGELSYLLGELPAARAALDAFTSAKISHPSLELAWTYLGDTCFGLEDLPGARVAYERSLAAFPQGRTADRARYGLARTLATSGERERALSLLDELVKKGSPEWVDRCWLQIGLIRESAGRPAEAAEAFSTLERTAPKSQLIPEAQLHRGLALAVLGRAGEAVELFRPLAANGPESVGPRAALELATIQLAGQHPEVALATLESALERYPKSPAAPALLFRSAEALQRQKRPAEAELRFLKLVEEFPDDAWADDAMLRAAQSALDRGDFTSCRRLAEAFAARFRQSALRHEVRLIEARAASLSGQPKDAVAILESLVGPSRDGAQGAGSPKGDAANAGDKNEGAPALPQAMVPAARYDLAVAYRAIGRTAEGDAILTELAKSQAGPITADAQFLVGQSRLDAGKYAEAVAPLEGYLAANPRGDVAEFAMAHLVMARLGLGQTDAALKMLGRLAEEFPDSKSLPPARLRAAEAALAARQLERAVEQFKLVALATKPIPAGAASPVAKPADAIDRGLRARAYRGLGKALAELGKSAEAASALSGSLELAPDDPAAAAVALAQGRVLEDGRQTDAALKAYSLVQDRYAKSDQAALASLARARLLGKASRHREASGEYERLIGDELARDGLAKAGAKVDGLLAEWGWTLVDAEKPAEADRVFGRLLKEHPDSPFAVDARFNLAESANLAHNYAEVVRLLAPLATQKSEAGKNASTGQTNSKKTEEDAGHPPDSLQRLLPAVLYRLGRTQVELKDWQSGIVTLDRLLTEFPENPYRREAQYLRAECALQRGDAAAALSGFSALLSEKPAATDQEGWISTVRLKQIESWIALKRWKEALEGALAMKRLRAVNDPPSAELEFACGQALIGLARLDEARAAFDRVIDSTGKGDLGAHALLMRGEAYFHQDKFHEALRDFLKVDILYKAPRWQAAALLEAGKVYERLDQWADAAETYGRLLARFPKEAPASEAGRRQAAASSRAALNGSARKS
jgi:cellulose synthase operon protein C